MKSALLILLVATPCFGQAFSFNSPAFLAQQSAATAAPGCGAPTDYLSAWDGGTFNGTSDYTSVTAPAGMWGDFTVSAWLLTTDVTYKPGSVDQTAVNLYKDASNGIRLAQDSSLQGGRVVCTVTIGGTGYGIESSAYYLTNNVANHIVITCSGVAQALMYVNTNSVGVFPSTSFSVGASSQLGAKTTTTGFWKGSVTKIRVWDRVVTTNEIATLFCEGP